VDLFKLLVGLVILVVGGNFLVKGSVALAYRFNISMVVVGLTVVSFSTSAPELIVSVYSAISGHSDIAIGNVIGSNIANLSLVLGATACFFPISFDKRLYSFDIPLMFLSSVLFGIFLYTQSRISFVEGTIFVSLIILLTIYLIFQSPKELQSNSDIYIKQISFVSLIFYLIFGAISLYFGSRFLVEGAVGIARYYGYTERLISLTVIAFGTSVPELTTSIIAAYKREKGLSIGNLIGSNIFNILAVIGMTSMIQPIVCNHPSLFNVDFLWMLGLSTMLFLTILFGTENKIGRLKGLLLFVSYFFYLAFIF
tara:strand:+ start:8931 stop:9863 length:933 start_codon:yes stop_codon:yes gene_type:complete